MIARDLHALTRLEGIDVVAAAIMVEALAELCPDVPVSAEPAIMRRWYKGAEPVYEGGRLVPWEPKK